MGELLLARTLTTARTQQALLLPPQQLPPLLLPPRLRQEQAQLLPRRLQQELRYSGRRRIRQTWSCVKATVTQMVIAPGPVHVFNGPPAPHQFQGARLVTAELLLARTLTTVRTQQALLLPPLLLPPLLLPRLSRGHP